MLWLLDFQSGSWAKLTHTTPDASDDEFMVHQYGSRRLWDEVDVAHRWWLDHGSPKVEQWRFTVGPKGQQIDLNPCAW